MTKTSLIIATIAFFVFNAPIWSQTKPLPTKWQTVEGWRASADYQTFDATNLYDHINGASDFYLGYKFQSLWVIPYTNNKGQTITLEVYEMADANFAFGIYAEERPETIAPTKIGDEGFIVDGIGYCLIGNCYLKVFTNKPAPNNAELSVFTQAVANTISETSSYPKQTTWFPGECKLLRTERFVPDSFLGRDDFYNVFTCRYNKKNVKFKLFVMTGLAEQTEKVLNAYLSANGVKKDPKTNQYLIKDKVNGPILMIYKNGVIVGIVEHPKPKTEVALLEQLLVKSSK